MITLDDVTVRLGGTTALEGFSGSFAPGSVTALIGGDGSGRSTLLRVLAGRLSPMRSETGRRGRAMTAIDPAAIGYQPATAGVWSNLSVEENIGFVARTYRVGGHRLRERTDELLARAGLDDARRRLAGRLSGGMRQKLGVVLATIHRPELVLLDEPTTGVDPVSRREIWALIAGAAADGATVVLATTYLDEAERADRLHLLGNGRVLAAGTPEEVVARMPGTLWETAAAGPAADAPEGPALARRSPRGWQRGATAYLWTPDADAPAPPGFTIAAPDLETTSIALQLAAEPETAQEKDALAQGDGSEPARHPRPRRDAVTTDRRSSGSVPSDAASEPRALVRADSVVRRYGEVTALAGVSLTVAAGEVVGLLGGNGAGKTTLMRILLGLESATSGRCTLLGQAPSIGSRRRIGYVAQGLGLYPSLSALENLDFAASVHGTAVSSRAAEFARDLGAGPVSALPLGAQRRLACFAATQHRPDLLILDEPTSGMDSLTRARLWKELRAEAERGAGVLVTTHYMQEAAQCDRLVVLTAGEVTATRRTRDPAALEETMRLLTGAGDDPHDGHR